MKRSSAASSIGPHWKFRNDENDAQNTSSSGKGEKPIGWRRPNRGLGGFKGKLPSAQYLKSITLDAAREFSEPLALDMATAKIAAMTMRAIPSAWRDNKIGKHQS